MPTATKGKAPTNPQRFGYELDHEEMTARSIAARQARKEARTVDVSKLKRLSSLEFYDNYTSKAFPGIWARFFNHQQRQYLAHYKSIAGDAPQYKTLCWRAAALSTSLAMMEANPAKGPEATYALADRARFDKLLIETIGQLQKYTESEKHESVIIDATKERVLSLVIAVADHVLADEAKPALFGALRRVIAGGEFDPARAISMLAQAVQQGEDEQRAPHIIDSTSKPLAPIDGEVVKSLSE